MNDELYKIIDEKGPEISKAIQVAAGQLYEKTLWYVRIRGAISVSEGIFVILFFLVWMFFTLRFAKKNNLLIEEGILLIPALSFLICLVVVLLAALLLQPVLTGVIQIVAPEWYLMDQIISKVGRS